MWQTMREGPSLWAVNFQVQWYKEEGVERREGPREEERKGGDVHSAKGLTGAPHLTIPYRCSAGSKGLSRLAWPPTQTWNPPAVDSESQIPPAGNQRRPCTSHYYCQEERLSWDSPGDRKRQRICGRSQGTHRARRPGYSDHTPLMNQAHHRGSQPAASHFTFKRKMGVSLRHKQDSTNTRALCY